MRILFLESHPIWIFGLPNGFVDAGHKVMVSGSLTKENIPKMIDEFEPELIISMGWTGEHTKNKVEWINNSVKGRKIPLVYWATEDPLHTKGFSIPLIQIMKPDFVFTVTPSIRKVYENLGFKSAHLDFAYHNNVHHRVVPVKKYCCNIAVVANAYPKFLFKRPQSFRLTSLQTLISPLLKENIRVDFWGKDWGAVGSLLGKNIPPQWRHGYLDYREAHKVYSSAKIVIGLQNCRNQLTQRTYEILGSGGFLLTSNTPAVRSKFKHKRDLLVSSSPQETVQLVKYYLNNINQIEQIRTQAKHALKNHSYQHRAERIIKVLVDNGIISHTVTSDQKGEIIHYPDIVKQKYEVHVVKKGDTLSAIAQKYGVNVNQIIELNQLESNIIDVGQMLKIKEKNYLNYW